jgi:non-specific protein-tyrosine kinase
MEKQIEELNIRKATTILETSRYAASKESLLAQKSRMERELNVLNDQLATDARGIEIASLEAQIGPNENEIASLSVQIATNENLIAGLETQIVQYRQINVTLLTNYEQTRLAEAQNVSNVVPVNTATPPLIPVRPKVLTNTLLAALIAMIMAISGILVLDSLDDTIKTPEDVVNTLGIPLVGVIFRYEEQQQGLITQAQPRSPISEAFRALRTNVQYANVDTPLRMIMVTSASPREGKSIIAANLAVVLAQGGIRVTGIKVTLIDADLRRPTLHKWFAVDNQNGLTHLIVQPQINLNGILKETKTRGLMVLTAGDLPPNPSEMLGSNKMSNIIQEIKKIQDVIIVDTPPVLAVADAAVLAPAMDGVLFVIQPGVTTFSAARQAIEQLKRVGANLVGVVLNNVDLRGSRYAYYYRNSYYYQTKYYAADDHKTKA